MKIVFAHLMRRCFFVNEKILAGLIGFVNLKNVFWIVGCSRIVVTIRQRRKVGIASRMIQIRRVLRETGTGWCVRRC